MPTLLKKIFHFFIFLLTIVVFSHSTLLAVVGTIFTLQNLRFLPPFPFDQKIMAIFGLAYILLFIFYVTVFLCSRKKDIFLSRIFRLTKAKLVFNLATTVLIITAAVAIAVVNKHSFLVVDQSFNFIQWQFSLKSLLFLVFPVFYYFCIFYPFSSILFELIEHVKKKKLRLPQSIVLIALAIFFNPVFISFGIVFLVFFMQRYQFEITHVVCGAKITQVTPDSPAAKAGLQSGEIIERVGDHQVSTTDEVAKLVQSSDLQNGLLIVTDKAAYQIVPTKDLNTGRKIIGITMAPIYCQKDSPVTLAPPELSKYGELTSFIDGEKMFTVDMPKDFNSYTESAYLTNSCTMFLDQPVEMEHGVNRVKGEGIFIQVCYDDAEMPATIANEMTHSQDTQIKVMTQPFSINGYPGFRTQLISTHKDIVEDIVFLQSPDGGYVTLKREVNGQMLFEKILQSFRFIKQTQRHFTTADQTFIRKYFSDQQKKDITVTFNYPSLDETMVSGNVYLPQGQTCFSAKRSTEGWKITQVGSDIHSQCD